jgi:hypothetical protein
MFNIKPEVTDFFYPYFQVCPGSGFVFSYGQNTFEYLTAVYNRVPVTQGLWLAGASYPETITDLFIGYSAADLICFIAQQPHFLLTHPEQNAFAALGLLPAIQQIQLLKATFPFARWHLLFGSDLLGRIADTFIATSSKGYPVSFRVTDTQIIGKYRDKLFYFDAGNFSLHQFELVTGLRAGMRTHKPPAGYTSFLAYQNLHEHDT